MDIDLYQPADAEDLAPLLEEMQAHYSVLCPPREAILASLKALPSGAEILVARKPRIVGMAGFGTTYPGPRLKPGFFLKDLYVTASERGGRIATHLLQHLARLAEERGLTRIDWTAARDNHRLLEFYDRIGGQRKEDRIFFRLEGDKLTALARHYD